jgi:hypothetical protein
LTYETHGNLDHQIIRTLVLHCLVTSSTTMPRLEASSHSQTDVQ